MLYGDGMEIISRKKAKELGLTHYFTGKPCKRGHVSKRYVSIFKCCQCAKEDTVEWYSKNPEKVPVMRKRSRLKHIDKRKAELAQWKRENKDKVSEYCKRWSEKNKEYVLKKSREWYRENKDKALEYRREYTKSREASDPVFRLRRRVSCLIKNSMKFSCGKGGAKTVEILGCTIEDFKSHLERQFQPGMTWENHGEWHIDHIIPASSATTEDELLALNHYTNLRPLWASENIAKGAKLDYLI